MPCLPLPGRLLRSLVAAIVLTAGAASAEAAPEVTPARVLGMGGALRGAATGGAGPTLNPSGMSLLKSYAIEGLYEHVRPDASNVGHVSIVDSTSGFNVGGGLYYTYAAAAPTGGPEVSRHEGGLSLSFPLGDRVSVGGTVKYLRTRSQASAAMSPVDARSGFTFDAGLTLRPTTGLSLGLVGYNLRDLNTGQAPLSAGAGVALNPTPDLLVALDGVIDFTTNDQTRGKVVSVMGGLEYTVAGRFALRAGGGYDGQRKNGHVSLGLSLVSEVGALDLGVRQDVSGSAKATFVGVAGRVFVPSP